MLLYIIRHGDPDYATDSLTERGKLQAEAVGKRMSLTFVPNHLYRENGGISLDFDAAYTHPAIMASGMHEAVPRIARDGDAFLERLGCKAEGGNYRILWENTEKIALFCHSAMARAWLSNLLHIPLHMMWSNFLYTHTGVTVLEFRNYASGVTAPRCLCYADMSHLYAEGLDMIYDNDKNRVL